MPLYRQAPVDEEFGKPELPAELRDQKPPEWNLEKDSPFLFLDEHVQGKDLSSLTTEELQEIIMKAAKKMKTDEATLKKADAKIARDTKVMGDMSEMIGDTKAKHIRVKDAALKVVGETLVATALRKKTAEIDEDPMVTNALKEAMKQKMQRATALGVGDKILKVKALLKKAKNSYAAFAVQEDASLQDAPKEMAAETLFAIKDEDMADIDSNNDGLLDEGELASEFQKAYGTVTLLEKQKAMKATAEPLAELVRNLRPCLRLIVRALAHMHSRGPVNH